MTSGEYRYDQWMGNLPARTTSIPLNWIAIPGSHDSAAYKFEPGLGVAISEPKPIRLLGSMCCGERIVFNWSKTQTMSVTEQLKSGIRYFDFRVAVHPRTKEMRFVHGLYGDLVDQGLSEINSFLDINTKEVVIVDFNHFYNMDPSDHRKLLSEIINTFKQKCIPCTHENGLNSDTLFTNLKELWKTQHRVIVFYHDVEVTKFHPHIWDGELIQSPWGDKNSLKELIHYLQNNYDIMQKEQAKRKTMYVWQGIGSVGTEDIALHLCSNLKTYIASEATERFVDWLKDGKIPGPRGINICIADFVEQHDYISTVIGLNFSSS